MPMTPSATQVRERPLEHVSSTCVHHRHEQPLYVMRSLQGSSPGPWQQS
jgi:hypothetical protein